MTHGQALIISQTTSAGAKMMEHLQRAGWKAEQAAPAAALDHATRLHPDLLIICGCDADLAGQTLEALKLDVRTTCIRTVLCGTQLGNHSVRVHADLEVESPELSLDALQSAEHDSTCCDVGFRVPNDCRYIDALTSRLHRLYVQLSIDVESDHRLTTAVREMVHNAIEWGNRGVADAHVDVGCRIEPHAVTIRVRDSGPGFDRNELPHAATSQDPTRHLPVRDALGLRAGGFGILMTRGLVDELSYNDAGNEVRIVKKIPTV